jgi:hypothetical protein
VSESQQEHARESASGIGPTRYVGENPEGVYPRQQDALEYFAGANLLTAKGHAASPPVAAGRNIKALDRQRAVEARKVIVGSVVLALIAVAVAGLYWIACYEARVCPGDRQAYVWRALIVILSLYALSIIHLVWSKLRGRK